MNSKNEKTLPGYLLENDEKKTILSKVRGIFALLTIILNTVILFCPILLVSIIKFFVPINFIRKICTIILNEISFSWIGINNFNIKTILNVKWEIEGLEDLKYDEWYLVISNHQTWIDIVVLQKIFYRKIPFIKFFLKKELIWVPLLNFAWWALDFPFMKRYSKNFLEKNPHLKGKDIEITKKACEKFKTIPVSVMNFVEGTRFTKEKHVKQNSPYSHLLKPKAGGIGFVLSAMGDQLTNILDVTIVYPQGVKSFWDFLCGRVNHIKVKIEKLPVEKAILGDYINDPVHKEKFQKWLNHLWSNKDRTYKSMLK